MKKTNKNSRESLLHLLTSALTGPVKSKKSPDRMKAKYKVTGPKVSLASESKRKGRRSK